jgi:hypothetical protein
MNWQPWVPFDSASLNAVPFQGRVAAAYCVFAVDTAGVLTVVKSFNMNLVRVSAGQFDFTFSTPMPDANWCPAVLHNPYFTYNVSGASMVNKSQAGGRLTLFESNTYADPQQLIYPSSLIIF